MAEEEHPSESATLLGRKGPRFQLEADSNSDCSNSKRHAGAHNFVTKAWREVQSTITERGWQTKHIIPVAILCILGVTVSIYVLVVGAPAEQQTATGDIRISLLADAHLIGPQYVCCTESNDIDNDSVMKTVDRLKAAQQQIAALNPPPAAVVFLGDVIHNGYSSHDFNWYLANRNAYTVGGEIFSSFPVPVRFLWGNHDYHTTCGNATASYDRALLSHRLFRHFLGPTALPYSAVSAGRYQLLFLNGMLGPSWDPGHPRCDTRQASLGAPQLAWLAEQLAAGKPTFVFLHHPLPAAMRSEAPELPHPDVLSMLMAHQDQVMAVFSGHYHRGLDWQAAYPFPHITLPASRFDPDNWFLLNLPQSGPPRSWRLLDWAKNKGGARCSETWTYPADPTQEPRPLQPQPPETGSCGRPLLDDVETFHLQPLQDVNEVPGPTGHQFNPEPPCCLKFQPAFLERCLQEGATVGCCDILGEHLRASSAAYAASCMCWPPFWDQAQQLFRDRGSNATQVLERCAADHGKALQWPGRAGGSCMLPGQPSLPGPADPA